MKKLINGNGTGWIRDIPDQRDVHLELTQIAQPPPMVDLSALCPPVFDQGEIGSCTANAIVAAMMMAGSAEGPDAPAQPMLSRLFVYYCERDLEGTADSDSGAMIRDGFKVIAKQGSCLEATWPYDPGLLTTKPDEVAYNEAKSDKAVIYSRVPQTLEALRSVIASGSPVVFGFTVYESFESPDVASTGLVPLPRQNESVLGGHAVLAVGYVDNSRLFLVRNSWGAKWGIQGYFLMPYEYLTSTDLSSDMWVVQKVT